MHACLSLSMTGREGVGVMPADPRERRNDVPPPPDDYHDPDEVGPLGEPESEPVPKGIFVLLAFFLVALVLMWMVVYLQLWARG
jgi:hypothetical protein